MKATAKHATKWFRAYRMALATEGKKPCKWPTNSWIAKLLIAEHSPIRVKEYDITIDGCRTWVFGHLVRHWLGFIPFIHSQREDRRKLDVPRDELPQGSLNDGDFAANAQALMAISRQRLCGKASPETREAWSAVKEAIREIDPVMADKMVPKCVYQQRCPELKCCGFINSPKYKEMLEKYEKKDYGENRPS